MPTTRIFSAPASLRATQSRLGSGASSNPRSPAPRSRRAFVSGAGLQVLLANFAVQAIEVPIVRLFYEALAHEGHRLGGAICNKERTCFLCIELGDLGLHLESGFVI